MSDAGEKSNKNGMVVDPLQRLASIKPPRDLSLGGIKPNKKVFTPNLNAARNKNKGPSSAVNSRDQKKDDRNKRDRKFDKNKFLKNGPNIIKSCGVFSEGVGSAERHSSRVSYGRDTDSTPVLRKPTIKVKDFVKVDNDLEEKKIKEAFGDGTSYEDDSEDFKKIHDVEAPVTLPMDDVPIVDTKPLLDVKEVFEDTNVVNLLKSDKPALILLQLADTLPGRGESTDEEVHPSTSSENQPEKPAEAKCRLKDLEEGRIGKLRVHQSGRVTMLLGDTVFEVCSGTKASFYQEVVSVAVDDSSRSARLISLGPLQHKLNVTPHWQTMFDNMSV